MNIEAVEKAATKVGSTATASGTLTTLYAWAASNEGLGFLGLLVALIGLAVTWYYKRESNKRQAAEAAQRQAERELRMGLMRATGRPILHRETDMGELEAVDD